MIEIKTNSENETKEIGIKLSKTLKGGDVVALFGGMGMGKTALTRGIVEGLESNDMVTSPTFAIVNEYNGKFKIYHFDMYRIETYDDLYSIGFFDFIDDKNSILIIEWSENIENVLPDNFIKVTIQRTGESGRLFLIEGCENI